MIFDTHAHYDDEAFSEDREEILSALSKFSVGVLVNVGADMASSRTTTELTKKYSFIYGAVGVHPDSAKEVTDEAIRELSVLADEEKIVAIGEIGLDYYWHKDNVPDQKEAFQKQLALALEKDLPVIIHSREAAQDTFDMMKENYLSSKGKLSGVIHCFSSGPEMAKLYTDMGFYLGIGGVVTFKNAKKLKEVVKAVPLQNLVLETDCPYLAPVPHRGERNFSGYLSYVCEEIAKLRGITRNEVEKVTEENARRLYRMEIV